jgi:low temperature requirement protein LtrA
MSAWVRWQPPRLRPEDEAREAKVTSVDLFYDLFFAIAVAQLAAGLSQDLTARGLLVFALLFVAVVRTWSSETFYSDHFETLDVSYRVSVFVATLPAGGLAIAGPQGLGALFPLFAVSVAASRLVLIGQWLRAGTHEPAARPLARRHAVVYSMVAVVWLAAGVVPAAARLALVVAGVLLDLVIPLLTTRLQADLGRFSPEHLSDRFGAFFLILLGQVIVFVVLVMTRLRQPSFADLSAGVLSFTVAFSLWWVYVDHVVGRPLRAGAPWNAAWSYLNIPLFMATGALGAAVFTLVTRGEQVVPDPVRWLLAGSFAMVMFFSGLAEIALEPFETPVRVFRAERRWPRLGVIHGIPALLAVAVAVLGRGLSAIPLLLLIIAVGLIAVALGEYVRAGQ